MKSSEYKICKRCVMDTSDNEIEFDEFGVCNHCKDFEKVLAQPKYDKKKAEAANP